MRMIALLCVGSALIASIDEKNDEETTDSIELLLSQEELYFESENEEPIIAHSAQEQPVWAWFTQNKTILESMTSLHNVPQFPTLPKRC